jgi:threonine dehydratase
MTEPALAPALDVDLRPERIAAASASIDPVYLNSPQYFDGQLCERLGRRVLTKAETFNPLRSFKGRGADFLVGGLPPGSTVVCGSTGGNFGQAIARAAQRYGLRAEVFVPVGASAVKLRRTVALGARVHPVDGPPKVAAAEFAGSAPDRIFVEDGREAAIAEGAGTIGVELLRDGPFDAVVLPVGDGALITGVACWIREHAPDTRIVGVTAAAAPALLRAWQTGEVRTVERRNAFAAGISIRTPVVESVHRTRALVDEMLTVEDAELLAAMRLAADTLGILLEPAGAAGLAAIARGLVEGEVLATVLTGANVDPEVVAGLWSVPEEDGVRRG